MSRHITTLAVTNFTTTVTIQRFSTYVVRRQNCSFQNRNFINCLRMSLQNMIWSQIACWHIKNLLMFHIICTLISLKNVEMLKQSKIWDQIMFCNDIRRQLMKFPFWKEQYRHIEKRKLKSVELWKFSWNCSSFFF